MENEDDEANFSIGKLKNDVALISKTLSFDDITNIINE